MAESSCGSCIASKSLLLTTCRFLAGGAFIVAAIMKMRDFSALMLSIQAFQLVPEVLIPAMAYIVPWTEIVCGLLLIYGIWSRASAGVAALLYAVFTVALASALLRGLKVDCGCFGALTGGGPITWLSVGRNAIFLAACGAVMAFGGGATALDAVMKKCVPSSRLDRIATSTEPAR